MFAAALSASPVISAPVAEKGDQPAAVSSLAGEECTIEPVLPSAVVRGLTAAVRTEARLQCGGHRVGSVAALTTDAGVGAVGSRSAASALPLRVYLAPDDAYACEAARTLGGGGPEDGTLVFPCRDRANGWPLAVLVRASGGRLVAASGPASAWPALKTAVGLPVTTSSLADQKAEIIGLWPYPITIAGASDQVLVQSLRARAQLANSHFAFAEAEAILRQALDLQVRLFGEKDIAVAAILMDTAVIVANQGRYAEADQLLSRAGPIVELSPRPTDRARLAGYYANVAWLRGDTARGLEAARSATEQWRAITTAESATPSLDDGPANPNVDPLDPGELAMALNREAGFMLQLDDPATANARASEALIQLNKAANAPRWWKADVLANLGASSIALGRLSAGEAYFKAAIALRSAAFGEDQGTLRMRVALGRAFQSEGLHTAAIVTYRDALRIAHGLPRESIPFTPDDLVPFAAAVVDEGADLEDDKARQGLFAEAFDAFQLASAPGRDRTVALATQRLASASPILSDLLRALSDAESSAMQARDALAKAQAAPADEQNPNELEALQAGVKQATSRLAGLQKKLTTNYPDFAALLSPPLPTLDAVRARLGDDEALVTFLVGRKASYVQLVRRSSLTLARVPLGGEELSEAVKGLRHGLEIEGKSVADFDLNASHSLYAQLLGPVARDLAGVKRLIVVPTGALASLPFAVLVTRPAQPGDYAGSHWLVQDMAITHTPSLGSFIALRSTRLAGNQAHALLAIADPVLGRAAPTIAMAPQAPSFGACRGDAPVAAEMLRALPSLPDTLREVSAVSRALGGDAVLLTGRDATEGNLRTQALNQYRILYFATHGVIPGELRCQAEPGLVLTPPEIAATTRATDGMLDSSEIAALDLRADLVVLSACNTAGANGSSPTGGETLSGLALAFFHAGARNLMVSHWQVPSAATARLMADVFATMHANPATSVDEALREAQLRAISDRTSAHPFFWGAFIVLGDGAAMPLQDRTDP